MSPPRWWRVRGRWAVILVVLVGFGVGWRGPWWLVIGYVLAVAFSFNRWQRLGRAHRQCVEENGRLRAQGLDSAKMRGRFVGNVAHELKTPLALLLAESELLLLRCEDPDAVRGIARSMATEICHLSDLVESFVRLAHPLVQEDRSGHLPVFVSDFVIAAVGRCGGLSKSLAVPIVTVLCSPDNGDPSAEVDGDGLLLEAMVENLVRNALRFSPSGAVVEVSTRASAAHAAIVVRDHGVGIPAGQREAVFDWFFERPGCVSQALGTGFGLAIAQRVAEHHRGAITLQEAPGGGCEFEVTLPRWHAPEAPTSASVDTRPPPPNVASV